MAATTALPAVNEAKLFKCSIRKPPLPDEEIALQKGVKWRNGIVLTVSFMNAETVPFMDAETTAALHERVVNAFNAWDCGVSFAAAAEGKTGDVRVKFDPKGGYWSYLGTRIKLIAKDKPTMCLGNMNMDTSDEEFDRIVLHEAGHTLGFPHEHMRKEVVERIDHDKAYSYYGVSWPKEVTYEQVLRLLPDDNLEKKTAFDENSIMCYDLPGKIMRDGKPVVGGSKINATDAAFAKECYPNASR